MELEPKSCEEVRDQYINWHLGVNYKLTTKSDWSVRDEIGIPLLFLGYEVRDWQI